MSPRRFSLGTICARAEPHGQPRRSLLITWATLAPRLSCGIKRYGPRRVLPPPRLPSKERTPTWGTKRRYTWPVSKEFEAQMRRAVHVVVSFIRSRGQSRLAWLIACVHAAWFFVAIANMAPPSHAFADFLDSGGGSSAAVFAGRPFHFTYESVPLKVLILADLPSMLVGSALGFLEGLFKTIHLNLYVASYFGAALLLVIATCQWLVIGNVQLKIASRAWGEAWLSSLNRHFALTIAFILLLAVVFVPVVNKKSRNLGFRSSAISLR